MRLLLPFFACSLELFKNKHERQRGGSSSWGLRAVPLLPATEPPGSPTPGGASQTQPSSRLLPDRRTCQELQRAAARRPPGSWRLSGRSRREGTGPEAASRGKRAGSSTPRAERAGSWGPVTPPALGPSLELNLEKGRPCAAWHSECAPETRGGDVGTWCPGAAAGLRCPHSLGRSGTARPWLLFPKQ